MELIGCGFYRPVRGDLVQRISDQVDRIPGLAPIETYTILASNRDTNTLTLMSNLNSENIFTANADKLCCDLDYKPGVALAEQLPLSVHDNFAKLLVKP